ncbi:MAG: PDZ domain-containing protein [Chloroflexi bacterium]|nr:PDZ domain-containing protein [Chloroflexota bacterium]
MEKKSSAPIIIVVGILALLFGCVLGGFLGGVASYLIASRVSEPAYVAPEQDVIPDRVRPLVPDMPDIPEIVIPAPFALVTAVAPDSPAEDAGIQVGDVIAQVNGEGVADSSLADLVAKHKPGDRITITMQRRASEREIEVVLGENPDDPDKPWLGITYRAMPGGMRQQFAPDSD